MRAIIGAEGRSYINFASNDYLALRFNQALIARAVEWAETYGVGSGASRLVTGNLDLFAPIEAKVAKLKGKPAALVMASGFQTNAAVLQALFDKAVLGAEPLVFADRLNHASMHFGCQAAGVRQLRYRHCDAAHLAELLSQYQGDERPRFILTESVFSMDGDVAPLADIARLAREHDACLIVDDAHATGILGRGGSGLSGDADIVIGTFSKALGSFGGYVACTETMRDYLINRCGGIIYSTALPPPVLGAIDAALDLVPGMDEERALCRAPRRAVSRRRQRHRARYRRFDHADRACHPGIAGRCYRHERAPQARRPVGFGDQAADGAGRHGAAPIGLHRGASGL